MSKIVEKLKKIKGLNAIKGCSAEQVKNAQDELDIIFPNEYVDYVKAFGCIDFGSTEWTGLNIAGRLNTVDATKREMKVNPNFPKGCFVLENLGIDAKLIIVDERGQVYLLQYDKKTYYCESISAYLDKCIERNK